MQKQNRATKANPNRFILKMMNLGVKLQRLTAGFERRSADFSTNGCLKKRRNPGKSIGVLMRLF